MYMQICILSDRLLWRAVVLYYMYC